MFEPIQQFIIKEVRRRGMQGVIDGAHICHNFRESIPKLFPNKQTPSEFIQPAYFKENTLVINAATPAWAQEIIMRKPQIIAEMNARAGKEVVKSLKTQISS